MVDNQIYLVEISRNAKKVFILLFPNFETPDIYKSCVMSEKQAQKLMNESDNMFEQFIRRFYLKFGRLQIEGFHNKSVNTRTYSSVSPLKKRFNVVMT